MVVSKLVCICRFLYKLDQPIKGKIEALATSYGASSVEYSAEAEAQVERYTKQGFDTLPICIAKTQYSFSADAGAKGAPSGFSLPVREVSKRAPLSGRDTVCRVASSSLIAAVQLIAALCRCRYGRPLGLASWWFWLAICRQFPGFPPGRHSLTSTLTIMARSSG
jgi:hypothetical protein